MMQDNLKHIRLELTGFITELLWLDYARGLSLQCIALALIVVSPVCGQESREELEREFLKVHDTWASWEDKISSIRVAGFEFFGVCDEATIETSSEFVRKMVESSLVPLVQKGPPTLDELRSVTLPLFVEGRDPSQPERPRGRWRTFTLVRDGGKVSKESEIAGVRKAAVRTPDGEQWYSGTDSRGSTFPTPTGLILEDVGDFVYRPSEGLPYDQDGKPSQEKLRTKFNVTHEGAQHTRVASSYSAVEFDSLDGFVHEHRWSIPPIQKFSQRYQYLPVVTDAGIPVARVFTKMHFKKATGDPPPVSAFYVFVVNEIEINPVIDPQQFELAVPAGTAVQKYAATVRTRDTPAPEIEIASKDVTDLAAFTNRADFGQQKAVPTGAQSLAPGRSRDSWASVILWINAALVVIVVGVYLVRRRQHHGGT
ncbi:MAG: hypothetical protein ACK5Q5_20760 [Planctomycetaceae bacterium]